MADIDHQYGRAAGLVLCFIDLEVFLFEREFVDPSAAVRVGQRGSQVDVRRLIAIRVLLCVAQPVDAAPGERCLVVPRRRLLQRGKYLTQCVLPDPLYSLRSQLQARVDFFNHTHLAQLVDDVVHGHLLIQEPILFRQALQPFEGLLHIAARLHCKVTEERDHLLEALFIGRRVGAPSRVPESHVQSSSYIRSCPPVKMLPTISLYAVR